MTLTRLDAVALGTIFEGILYGAYVVLFILYLVLRRRNHRGVDGPLTLAHILLFALCTLALCLDIPADYFLVIPDVVNKNAFDKLTFSSLATFVIIDYLAQMILLYRCWIIWNRRWVVVAIPGLLALVTLGGGFVILGLVASPLQSNDKEKFTWLYSSFGTIAYSISLGVNALTTSLIVAKIILVSREVRPDLGSHRLLDIVTATLIESGLLMFAFQLVYVVLFSAHLLAVDLITGPITQIYGIAPTLLSLRVVMGSAYDKTTEKVSSLKFTHPRGAATQTTGPRMSAAGVQSRVTDIELDSVSDNEQVTRDAV